MAVSIQQYATALYESLQETTGKDHDIVIENLVQVLKRSNELHKFEAIIDAFEKLHKEHAGVTEATVTTATPVKIDKTMMDELNAMAGSKVDITQKVDESIIGGVIIRMEDTQLDASVKTKLEHLKKTLSQ